MGIFDFAHRVCVAGNVKVKEALVAVKAGEHISSIMIPVSILDQNHIDGALILLMEATSEAEILAYNRKLADAQDEIRSEGRLLEGTDERFKQKGQALTNQSILGLKPLELKGVQWNASLERQSFVLHLGGRPFTEQDLGDLVWLTLKEKFDRTHQDLGTRLERIGRKVVSEVNYNSTEGEEEISLENARELIRCIARTQGEEAIIDFTSEDAGSVTLDTFNKILAAENFNGTREILAQVARVNTRSPDAHMVMQGAKDGMVTVQMSTAILAQFSEFLARQEQAKEEPAQKADAEVVSFAEKAMAEGRGPGRRTCPPAMGPIL